jgi:hypothetical protein
MNKRGSNCNRQTQNVGGRFLDVNGLSTVNTSSPSCSSFTASTDTGTPSSIMYNKINMTEVYNQSDGFHDTDEFRFSNGLNNINNFQSSASRDTSSASSKSKNLFANRVEAVV